MMSSLARAFDASLRHGIQRMISARYWLLALAAIIGVAAAYTGRSLHLDRSIESMFADDDPILVPYRRLQRTFGAHEVVLAMYADPKLTTSEGLARLDALAKQIRATPGVVAAVALGDLPGGTDFDDKRQGAAFRQAFEGYTHNRALDAAGVICLIERPVDGKTPRRETLARMRELIHERPQGALVGEPVLIEEAFDLLEQDGRRLNTWCTVLVLLTIYLCFRSVRWLVLPLAVVQLTLAMTNATLVLAGLELSMVSSMLGAIITVVGVASVVHVMVHYQDGRRDGADRRQALSNTLYELATPITVAVLTDGAGFAALMVSKVGPVHDFGLMMAIGSLLVLPACLLLVPGLTWLSDGGRAVAARDDRLALGPWLARMLVWANRHVRLLVIGGVAMTVLAMIGSRRLKHETDFTENFRDDSSIVRSYHFVETRFGGAGVWDLLVPAPTPPPQRAERSEAKDKPVALAPPPTPLLNEVWKVQRELEKLPLLSKTTSLADCFYAALVAVRMVDENGSRGPFREGFMGRSSLNTAFRVMRGRMPEFVDSIYNTDPDTGRPWLHVLLRAPEQLEAEDKSELIAAVQREATKQFPEADVTGYYVLLTRLIESVLADQWKALVVAGVMIFAMMIAAIRDLRLTLVTFVPNMIPSLVLFGAMGWLGIKVNMGAAMIAAVSVGLSVDSSVHYTMFFQRARRKGLTTDAALARAQDSVGRAAVFSTLALTVGFGTLCVSDFVPTIYFGVLVSLSMIGGLIGNLLVLPVLIRAVERRDSPVHLQAAPE